MLRQSRPVLRSNFLFVACLVVIIGQLHCLPLTEPGNDDVKTATSLPAPKVFPKDANIYKIVPNNETILKFLQHSDDAKVSQTTSKLNIDDYDVDEDESDVENIQSNKNGETNDDLEERYNKPKYGKMDSQIFDDTVIEVAAPISHSNLAAILLSTLALIAICVYVALVVWRRKLEKRYGMRERLVNEEDFYQNNDGRELGGL